MAAVEVPLDAKKAHIERLEREFAAGAEKRQQLLPKRQETSQTASCTLAKGEDPLRDLQLVVTAMTAERNEWRDLETESTKKLKAAEVEVALQLTLWQATRKGVDTDTADNAKF